MPRSFNLKALHDAIFETPGERDVRSLRAHAFGAVAAATREADKELFATMRQDAESLDHLAFQVGLQRARAAFEQSLLYHVRHLTAAQSAWAYQMATDLVTAEQSMLAVVQAKVVNGGLDAVHGDRLAIHIRQKTESAIAQALRMTNETADLLNSHLATTLITL